MYKPQTFENSVQLTQTYIHGIGQMQPTSAQWVRDNAPSDLRQASWLLGEACQALVGGDTEAAEAHLYALRANMAPVADPSSEHDERTRLLADHLSMTATTIEIATVPDYPQRTKNIIDIRKVQRRAVLNHAWRTVQAHHPEADPEENRLRRGDIAEDLTLAGLMRYTKPGLMAFRALPHHDDSGSPLLKHTHHDVVVAHNKTGQPTVQAVQVKNQCLGFCNGAPTQAYQAIRPLYSPDIVFISGHCDLQPGFEAVGKLLYEEVQTKSGHLLAADLITRRLVAAVTGNDPLRRGTWASQRAPAGVA